MTPEELDRLADRIAKRISPPPSPLIDAAGAADLLGVPASWVLSEARSNRIPCVRLGRYVRFDACEVRAWATAKAARR